jgi:hypothetical protein
VQYIENPADILVTSRRAFGFFGFAGFVFLDIRPLEDAVLVQNPLDRFDPIEGHGEFLSQHGNDRK